MHKYILIPILSIFWGSPSSSQNPVQLSTNNQEVGKTYRFQYTVKDEHEGTQFGRKEQSDGNKVQGVYSVNLPDGRYQTVHYEAEVDTGFKATVTYDEEDKFDLKPEKVDRANQRPPKPKSSNKSTGFNNFQSPIPKLTIGHKPMIIVEQTSGSTKPPITLRPLVTNGKLSSTLIKRKFTSKPGIDHKDLSPIKQFSFNKNKQFKAKPFLRGGIVDRQTRLPKFGNKQYSPDNPPVRLPPVYNTVPIKSPGPYPLPDTVYAPTIHKPPPDRPTPKYHPYTPPSCLGCG